MGFKSMAQPKQPPMLVIVDFSGAAAAAADSPQSMDAAQVKASNLAKEGEEIKKLKAALPTGAPLGIILKTFSDKTTVQLKNAGVDFVVFGAADASPAVLLEDEPGKIVIAEPSWTDINLRSLDALPVDAILVEDIADKTSITLEHLMALRRYSLLTGKPLLVRLSYLPGEKDLSALLRVPVRGLVLTVKSEKDLAETAKLRTTIQNLPPIKPKKTSITPLLPQLSQAEFVEEEEEEEEEDE